MMRCRRRESNPHILNEYSLLRRACLPVTPLRRELAGEWFSSPRPKYTNQAVYPSSLLPSIAHSAFPARAERRRAMVRESTSRNLAISVVLAGPVLETCDTAATRSSSEIAGALFGALVPFLSFLRMATSSSRLSTRSATLDLISSSTLSRASCASVINLSTTPLTMFSLDLVLTERSYTLAYIERRCQEIARRSSRFWMLGQNRLQDARI